MSTSNPNHQQSDIGNRQSVPDPNAERLKARRTSKLLKDFDEEIFLARDKVGVTARRYLPRMKPELIVSFAGLHRMRMRKLQIELANRVMSMHFKKEEPNDWERLLNEYITAVRDNDYIQTCVERGEDDPFIFSSSRAVEAEFLELEINHIPESERLDKRWTNIKFDGSKRSPKAYRGKLSKGEKLHQTFLRLGMAFVGGVFLIGPMWLMVLQNRRYTTLITTTAFVFGFGFALSIIPFFFVGARLGMDTVLSATAAYAAVLVVFVGTTLQATTGGS